MACFLIYIFFTLCILLKTFYKGFTAVYDASKNVGEQQVVFKDFIVPSTFPCN